jgi:hypothetical protein
LRVEIQPLAPRLPHLSYFVLNVLEKRNDERIILPLKLAL